ncbi:MAG: tetratricopeptide repeat protein, partial [Gammaproteobacteria bacterium]
MSADSDQALAEARASHRAGDTASAMRIYQRLLQTHPHQPELLILAATAAAQLGRLDEAEQMGRRAFEIRPDGPAALTLGRILMQRGETEEALGWFQQARTDTRVAADAAFHQGQLERAAGRFDAAADALGAALETAPNHAPAWNELGVTRMAQYRHKEARTCFETSLEHRPGDLPTLGNLARACIEAGDTAAAERAIDALCADHPGDAGGSKFLGALRKQQGRLTEAASAWEQATVLAPEDAGAWTGLATTRQAMADYAAAAAAYDRALALAPDNPDTIAARAEWLEWQGRYQDGIDSLEVLTPAQRSDAGPSLVAARLWRRLGEPARARDLLA